MRSGNAKSNLDPKKSDGKRLKRKKLMNSKQPRFQDNPSAPEIVEKFELNAGLKAKEMPTEEEMNGEREVENENLDGNALSENESEKKAFNKENVSETQDQPSRLLSGELKNILTLDFNKIFDAKNKEKVKDDLKDVLVNLFKLVPEDSAAWKELNLLFDDPVCALTEAVDRFVLQDSKRWEQQVCLKSDRSSFSSDFYDRLSDYIYKDFSTIKIHENGDDRFDSRNLDGNADPAMLDGQDNGSGAAKKETGATNDIHSDEKMILDKQRLISEMEDKFARATKGVSYKKSSAETIQQVNLACEGTIIILNEDQEVEDDSNTVVMRVNEPNEDNSIYNYGHESPSEGQLSSSPSSDAGLVKSLRKVRMPRSRTSSSENNGVEPLRIKIGDDLAAHSGSSIRSPGLLLTPSTSISSISFSKRAAAYSKRNPVKVCWSPTILSKIDAEKASLAINAKGSSVTTAVPQPETSSQVPLQTEHHSSLKTVIRLPKIGPATGIASAKVKKGKRKHTEEEEEGLPKKKKNKGDNSEEFPDTIASVAVHKDSPEPSSSTEQLNQDVKPATAGERPE